MYTFVRNILNQIIMKLGPENGTTWYFGHTLIQCNILASTTKAILDSD